ncbi:MAG: hypothetical protein JZU52_00605, partial [Lamprocystis purpurea]|nr:hypothetical protein [Lamprocystis purpurea]
MPTRRGLRARIESIRSLSIWFLVRPPLLEQCQLQHPSVWRAFTGQPSWPVHYWGALAASTHRHYRHPQVLVLDLGGDVQIELIGLHLKSKINLNKLELDADGNPTGAFLAERSGPGSTWLP